MDYCGPRGADLVDPKSQVRILTLSPNCMALHHPMDMGIVSTWKKNYCSILLKNQLLVIETPSERKKLNKSLKAEMKEISQGYKPRLLDVSNMVKEACNTVSDKTVANCWKNSKIIQLALGSELSPTCG